MSCLPGLPDADLCREVVESKARVEDLLGSDVTCFAYPGGGVDARVRAAVARAGYSFVFSTRAGLNFRGDPLCLRRIRVTEGDTAIDLALKLSTGRSIRQDLPGKVARGFRTSLQALYGSIPETLKQGVRKLRPLH
ncbi:MAG: polysaccharide deacetylase family protein [Terriglobia bacterium]|jgi:peptidoglycan/xylan/chitin deacetylase (PgdA/CDA1 family)